MWSPRRPGSPGLFGRSPDRCWSVPPGQMLVDQGPGIELRPSQDKPDRLDRLVADRREPMRDGRIDRDRVTRLEHVLLEPDPDLEPTAQDIAPFMTGMALE